MLVLNMSSPTTPATSIAMTSTANGVRAAWVRPIARRGGTTVRRARSTAASANRGHPGAGPRPGCVDQSAHAAVSPRVLLLTRSTARSRTEAARGFWAISSGEAFSAPRVSERSGGSSPAGTTGRSGGTVEVVPRGEGLLDEPVLERVVAHHHDAAADADGVDGGGDGPAQHAELVVDLDAQRLEGALGRVSARTPRRRRDRLAEQLDQPGRAGERLGLPLPDDRPGDLAGELLLAVAAQDPGQLGGGVGVEHVGRGRARRCRPSACRAGASSA